MNGGSAERGFGNRAVPCPDRVTARTLIYAAASVLLELPGVEDPNRNLIVRLAEPVVGNGASCRAEKLLKSVHDIVLREIDGEVDLDLAAGAFLFVIHRGLSAYCYVGTPAYPIYVVASALRLHRPQVWEIASELARLSSAEETSNGYSQSLATCKKAFGDFWDRLDDEAALESVHAHDA